MRNNYVHSMAAPACRRNSLPAAWLRNRLFLKIKYVPVRLVFAVLLPFVCNISRAQTFLTEQDAVNAALKNNFDILVARNDADIARINNTPGNAGMLPGIDVSGSAGYALNNVHQNLSGGTSHNYPSMSVKSLSAGSELSWTLFDGGKMFVTRNKLNEIQTLGEIRFRDKVLQTLSDVIAAYYDVVRQNQQLVSIKEVLNFNQERVKIAQAGFDAGSLLKTDLLQAKIDLNVTRENVINQEFAVEASKRNLNTLLGRPVDTGFVVADTIPLSIMPGLDQLKQRIDSVNTSILMYRKQIDIATLTVKENSRLYSPVVNLRGGYYLSRTINSDGSVLKNSSLGPQVGGSLVIPIFSAGENRRMVSVSKIQLQSAEYDLQNVTLQVNQDLDNALKTYENQQQLMEIEKENNELARENFEISLHRLRQGQTTSLEVHQAQENFVQSNTRLINFSYNVKIAETKLRQMMAAL